MKTPRAVFDTNILISAIVFGGNPEKCLKLAREGKIRLFTSNAILLELAEKLDSKIGMSGEGIGRTLKGIGKISEIVMPQETLRIIKEDEPDNRILEAAKEAKADYLVSGDKKHILPLKKFENTQIVSAAEFIKLVDFED